MKTLYKHLKSNRGDVNVSKATLVAIVFVVGAILLVMTTSAFRGPITAWIQTRVNDWFKAENGAFEYKIDPFEAYERNENGTYKGLYYRCHMEGDDYWYVSFPESVRNNQDAADVALKMVVCGNPILGYGPNNETVEISPDGKTITMGMLVFEAYIPEE